MCRERAGRGCRKISADIKVKFLMLQIVANERRDSTLPDYVMIKQVSEMVIFTQSCKIQKYFVKIPKTSEITRFNFKCVSCNFFCDDIKLSSL